MQIVQKKTAELTPYENNPRNNDAAVEAVANSIREFGFKVPCVIDKDGVIVAGHTRLKAAKMLGMEEVPCIVADDLTPEQVKAFRLADNKTAQLAEWNMDMLFEELDGIENIDMADFGFDDMTQADSLDDVEEDDYEEEDDLPARVTLGDIWRLGDHYLMCGDSTKDIPTLFNGEHPRFVFTDPPYGVAIGDKNKELNAANGSHAIEKNIIGDALPISELQPILTAAMNSLRENCAEDCSYYVTGPTGNDLGLMMLEMMRDAGLPVRHQLIWVKNAPTFSMGRLDYDYQHEPIMYTWGKKHTFYGGYSTSVIDDTTPIDKMSKSELKDLVRALQGKDTSVIYCDKPMQSKLHPTMKPVKLVARLMVNSSRQGDAVADIFGGSGTTMIAAEQLGRRCYMMELDPHYCDVILDRWEKFTGKQAVKVTA